MARGGETLLGLHFGDRVLLWCLPSRAALALVGSLWQQGPVLLWRSVSALSLAWAGDSVHHPHL